MRRGLAFDLAVLAANLVVAWRLEYRLSETRIDALGVRSLVVAALVAQAAGALLKAPHLISRRRSALPGMAGALFGPGILLNLALGVLLLVGSGVPTWFLPLALVSSTCVVAAGLAGPARVADPRGWSAGRRAEAAGDVLLWLAAETVLVLFGAYFSGLVTWRETGPHLRDEVPLWAGVALATLFQTLFFYAPFRLLYLLEDARKPATWVLMALAVLPLQAQVVASWVALPVRLSCTPRSVVLSDVASGEVVCVVATRFSGEVSIGCEPMGGAPIACSASPARLSLEAGGSATVHLILSRQPQAWPGEAALLVRAEGGGAGRDQVLIVRVERAERPPAVR